MTWPAVNFESSTLNRQPYQVPHCKQRDGAATQVLHAFHFVSSDPIEILSIFRPLAERQYLITRAGQTRQYTRQMVARLHRHAFHLHAINLHHEHVSICLVTPPVVVGDIEQHTVPPPAPARQRPIGSGSQGVAAAQNY